MSVSKRREASAGALFLSRPDRLLRLGSGDLVLVPEKGNPTLIVRHEQHMDRLGMPLQDELGAPADDDVSPLVGHGGEYLGQECDVFLPIVLLRRRARVLVEDPTGNQGGDHAQERARSLLLHGVEKAGRKLCVTGQPVDHGRVCETKIEPLAEHLAQRVSSRTEVPGYRYHGHGVHLLHSSEL